MRIAILRKTAASKDIYSMGMPPFYAETLLGW
jgi:hypothetical protein